MAEFQVEQSVFLTLHFKVKSCNIKNPAIAGFFMDVAKIEFTSPLKTQVVLFAHVGDFRLHPTQHCLVSQ